MSEFADLQRRLPKVLLGLVVAVAAGFLFNWLNTPLPWMIGPLLTVGIANLLGSRLDIVPYGRQAGQLFIGTGVGLHFTPPVLVALLDSAGWIFGGGIAVMLIAGSSGLLLSKFSGIDRTSCFFATVPGGAAEMALLAHRYGGSVPAVAVAQSVRVALLVLIIPPILTYAGFADIDRSAFRVLHPVIVNKLAILLSISLAVGATFAILKLQNPWMMGPLLAAAALTAFGIDLSAVPREVTNISQVMLGMSLGSRFEREFFLRHRFFVPFALINAAYLIIACAALAFATAWISNIHFDTLLVALAPGGIAEMAITAEALGLGVATVTAFQFVRIVLANFGSPMIFRGLNRLSGRKIEPPRSK
jgi:membrane AbrB-like protein